VGNTELLPDRLLRSAVLVTVADVVVHKSEVLHVLDRGRELERPLEWRPKELARSRTERSAHTLASARDLMGHASSQWLDIGDECERAFEVRQEAPIDVAEEFGDIPLDFRHDNCRKLLEIVGARSDGHR